MFELLTKIIRWFRKKAKCSNCKWFYNHQCRVKVAAAEVVGSKPIHFSYKYIEKPETNFCDRFEK
jgi:hypothetical protein